MEDILNLIAEVKWPLTLIIIAIILRREIKKQKNNNDST